MLCKCNKILLYKQRLISIRTVSNSVILFANRKDCGFADFPLEQKFPAWLLKIGNIMHFILFSLSPVNFVIKDVKKSI